MSMIVISAVAGSLLALVCARYLWLWGTRDRRYDAAYVRFTRQIQRAERRRALSTETGLMPVITEAPVRVGDTLDTPTAHGVRSIASGTTHPSGGRGGNAVVATDNAPSGAVAERNAPAGEPVYRASVAGVPGRSVHLITSRPVLRAGGVTARQTVSPHVPERAVTRTPRSA